MPTGDPTSRMKLPSAAPARQRRVSNPDTIDSRYGQHGKSFAYSRPPRYHPRVTTLPGSDSALEQQRAEIEAAFHERWIPLPGSEPQLLTEDDYAEAREFIAHPGKTSPPSAALLAVWDGAQPGDALPHDPELGPNPNPEVIIIGTGPGRRVAVLFPHPDFPETQFGHRFEQKPPGGNHEAAVGLIEWMQAGALHRMMQNQPGRDSAGLIWTPTGTPSSDPELEHQRARMEAAFRDGWRPYDHGQPRILTEREYTATRKVLDLGGWTGLPSTTIEAVRGGAQPGDVMPPPPPAPFIRHVTDAHVILTGSGPARRVAVLFAYEPRPGLRFGHRFPLEPFGQGHEDIWLMEEIETGALDRMMQNPPTPDHAGITWTTWGDQDPDRCAQEV